MKAYLISACSFAAACVLVAASDGPPLIAAGCLAFALASIMAYRVECGIAKENKEFTDWKHETRSTTNRHRAGLRVDTF